eukprot:10792181-Ditylum_brightwellii.AAC.1
MTELQIWMMCYPVKYLAEVVTSATNPHLKVGPVCQKEIIIHIGCATYMTCYQAISDRQMWCSNESVDQFDGVPFRLNQWMLGK